MIQNLNSNRVDCDAMLVKGNVVVLGENENPSRSLRNSFFRMVPSGIFQPDCCTGEAFGKEFHFLPEKTNHPHDMLVSQIHLLFVHSNLIYTVS